jgi:uncharacterized phage infection (PIP) family protein YhgE
MSALRALFAQREAKAAIAIWALLPTLFLFFAITLAVDPPAHLDKVRLGFVVLDSGVQTPQGQVVVATHLVDGLRNQLHIDLVQIQSEGALRDAVLAHSLAGGIVFPPDMTRDIQAGQPVALQVIKSDANDPVSNALVSNLSAQLSSNMNAALPVLQGGQPAPPLVSVTNDNVATSPDFRFPTIPAALLLPLWIATVAFSTLIFLAAKRARRDTAIRPWEMGLVELSVAVAGAAITSAVVTLDLALFTWRWDLDFTGLFGFLWLGLVASAWLIMGTIHLLGLELGVLLAVIALFVQQPVSGATFPSAFAPEAVRWVEGFAPLRYLVEGLRNLLIGGSTTPDMAIALAMLAGAGILLFAGGVALTSLMPSERRKQKAQPVQPVASA